MSNRDDAAKFEANASINNLLKAVTQSNFHIEETAVSFFKALKHHPAKQRNLMAKAMGKAMALWLVPVEDNNSTDELECDQSYDSEEVLRIWMRVALSRELHTSCRFEGHLGVVREGVNDNQSVVSTSTNNTNNTSNTNGSKSLVLAISRRSQMLTHLLYPVLQPISTNTEGYIFAPTVSKNNFIKPIDPIDHTSDHPQLGSNYLLNMLRSVFGRTRNIVEVTVNAARPESLRLDTPSAPLTPEQIAATVRNNIYDLLYKLLSNLASIQERQMLPSGIDTLIRVIRDITVSTTISRGGGATDAQLQLYSRLELVNDNEAGNESKVNEDGNGISLQKSSSTDSATNLTSNSHSGGKHFKETTPSKQDNKNRYSYNSAKPNSVNGGGSVGSGVAPESLSAEEQAELMEQFSRFEHGRYYTSCTALLFLRLICPAIINPDWFPVKGEDGG
eukprot:gene29313-36340_t